MADQHDVEAVGLISGTESSPKPDRLARTRARWQMTRPRRLHLIIAIGVSLVSCVLLFGRHEHIDAVQTMWQQRPFQRPTEHHDIPMSMVEPEDVDEAVTQVTKNEDGVTVYHSKERKVQLDQAFRLRLLLAMLQRIYPMLHNSQHRESLWPAIEKLYLCLEADDCEEGRTNVVLTACIYFNEVMVGRKSGENIWAASSLAAFEQLKYSVFMSAGEMEGLFIYQLIPDLVKVVMWWGTFFDECMKRDENTNTSADARNHDHWQTGKKACLQTKDFPEGIPIWKSFVFHFWGGHQTPMPGNWTLSPEDYAGQGTTVDNQYLGYSIEERCKQVPMFSTREHRAFILGKRPEYFVDPKMQWPGMLDDIAHQMPAGQSPNGQVPFQIVAAAGGLAGADGSTQKLDEVNAKGVKNLGGMTQEDWTYEVSRSKLLLGIGSPASSPSPYDALCAGVPFINPIFWWDSKNTTDRKKWQVQSGGLKEIDEPYVYHVFKHNRTELETAIRKAITTPIGRYIPPRMTTEAVRARHETFVLTDWRKAGEEWYLANKKGDPAYDKYLWEEAITPTFKGTGHHVPPRRRSLTERVRRWWS